MKKMRLNKVEKQIIELIKTVPKGKVSTYGRIAKLAGEAINPRQVGFVLRKYSASEELVWQRIVNSAGKLSVSKNTALYEMQKQFLENEGVVFSKSDRIDLDLFAYDFY